MYIDNELNTMLAKSLRSSVIITQSTHIVSNVLQKAASDL